MSYFLQDPIKWWVTFWGRRQPVLTYQFPDDEIVVPGKDISVPHLTGAIFANLHPTLHAVITSPEVKDRI